MKAWDTAIPWGWMSPIQSSFCIAQILQPYVQCVSTAHYCFLLFLCLALVVLLCFETGFHCVALALLEFIL